MPIPLTDAAGAPLTNRFALAPDPHVDVAVVSLNDVAMPGGTPFTFNHLDPSLLLRSSEIATWFVGVGDQVFALGYPLGITSAKTSYPIAKAGYLAAPPGETFALNFPSTRRNGTSTTVQLDAKVLVVDGLIVPGNSGGPVVLPSDLKMRRDPKTKELQFATAQADNFVVGVVSMDLGDSGLTVCFSTDYVIELVDSLRASLLAEAAAVNGRGHR